MRKLQCIITGDPISKLGSMVEAGAERSESKSADPSVDGVSTNIGPIHKRALFCYVLACSRFNTNNPYKTRLAIKEVIASNPESIKTK